MVKVARGGGNTFSGDTQKDVTLVYAHGGDKNINGNRGKIQFCRRQNELLSNDIF